MIKIKEDTVSPSKLNDCEIAVLHSIDLKLDRQLVQRRGDKLVLLNENDGWSSVCSERDTSRLHVRRLALGTTITLSE